MIRIAICEDNLKHQKSIVDYLEKYQEKNYEDFQIETYIDGIDLVEEFAYQYDIIFLDIEMKLMDGIEAAKKVREKDKEVIIIFITNLAKYAIQGYDVEAKGFLLKPVNYIAMEKQLGKCLQEIGKKTESYLTVRFAGGMKKIPMFEILYMESEGHYLVIHTTKEAVRILSSIKNMENKVGVYNFCRCNNGTLVNLMKVESVNQNELYIGGKVLPISRAKKKKFMEELTNYIGGSRK